MIDLHSHVLPGIDDGAQDLETAVAMCRMAAADGCEAIVATPHQRTERWENADQFALEALRRTVDERLDGRPALLLGGEIRVDSDLMADLESAGSLGPLPLAGSRYLLLELDRHAPGPDPVELAHELLVAGWVPVFAHPELIPSLAGDLPLCRRLAALGACFQVTAMSVTGELGRYARGVAQQFLDAGLVHFVASDCHGVRFRPPGLSKARQAIARQWGEAAAARLTRDNPLAVIEDRPLSAVA